MADLTPITLYVCEECERVSEDKPEGPGYECPECGGFFSRPMSENGDHRSPCCNKFSSRAYDLGCDECGGEVNETTGIICPHCEAAITEED